MDDYYNLFLNKILDYLNEGVYFTDLNQNILYCNSGAEHITGYQLKEIVMKKYCDIMAHTDPTGKQLCEKRCPIEKARKGQMQETFMFIYHKDGHKIPATIRTFPVYDKADQLTGFIELITDNSRQKLGADKINALTQAAYIDTLSELFSKQYLEHKIQTLLSALPDSGKPFGILYINIIGFRAINELYGVSRGDKILRLVAKTLAGAISSPDIIGRWHGASFIVIVNNSNKSLLLMLANKLKTLIAEAVFAVQEETIPVSITVSYTLAHARDTFDYLIERATKAPPEEKAAEAPKQVQKDKKTDDNNEKSKKRNTFFTRQQSDKK